MTENTRFTIKSSYLGQAITYVLQIRKSCTATIAQDWLTKKGINTEFKLRGYWYEASWQDSPQAEAIAPLLQAGAAWDLPDKEHQNLTVVPYDVVAGLAAEYGAIECCWRESERSFTGFVAEVWFNQLPSDFAQRWATVIGYAVKVRRREDGPAPFSVSIPCSV
ncbi:MAG TPA: hypothetical protein V6C65_32440 [Allocoleopsis sp.]